MKWIPAAILTAAIVAPGTSAAVPPTVCPAPTVEDLVPFPFIPIRPQPIEGGDITVVDAQPLPTSKDQCKRGGRQQYGFANQGQCVRFVATG